MQIPRINIGRSSTQLVEQFPLSPITAKSISTVRRSTKTPHQLTARASTIINRSNNTQMQKLLELKDNLVRYSEFLSNANARLSIDVYFSELIIKCKDLERSFDILLDNINTLNNKSQVRRSVKLEMSNTSKKLFEEYMQKWKNFEDVVSEFIHKGNKPLFNIIQELLSDIMIKLQNLNDATYDCTRVTLNGTNHFNKILSFIKHVKKECRIYCSREMHDTVALYNIDVQLNQVFGVINEYITNQMSRLSTRNSELVTIKSNLMIDQKKCALYLDSIIAFDELSQDIQAQTNEMSVNLVSIFQETEKRKTISPPRTARPRTVFAFNSPQIICKTQEIKF